MDDPCSSGDSDAEHVWVVKVLPRELARSKRLTGKYHVYLTRMSLTLVGVRDRQKTRFPVSCIRRCGRSGSLFLLGLGQSAVTGAGNIWMQTDDDVIAQNMQSNLRYAMYHPCNHGDAASGYHSSDAGSGGCRYGRSGSMTSRRRRMSCSYGLEGRMARSLVLHDSSSSSSSSSSSPPSAYAISYSLSIMGSSPASSSRSETPRSSSGSPQSSVTSENLDTTGEGTHSNHESDDYVDMSQEGRCLYPSSSTSEYLDMTGGAFCKRDDSDEYVDMSQGVWSPPSSSAHEYVNVSGFCDQPESSYSSGSHDEYATGARAKEISYSQDTPSQSDEFPSDSLEEEKKKSKSKRFLSSLSKIVRRKNKASPLTLLPLLLIVYYDWSYC
ncbi:uncharacterized protein [Panulirus ornatus]|uniref:uncharacterized protein n=1 Tax=Panulirus ornatus TaxID=150431 RepID=UPI003A89A7A6